MKTEKTISIIGLILGLILISIAILITAQRLLLISGFPKGVDAYAHLTRIVWVLTRFPQMHWNPSWNSGTFFWLWSYPPFGALASVILVKFFSIGVTTSLSLVAFICFLAFSISFYFAIGQLAGFWLAIPVALLAVTTPALWSWWGHGGNYIRIWGLGLYGLSLASLISYIKSPKKFTYVLLTICLGLTLTTHMLFTALTILTCGGYILFAVGGLKNKIAVFLKTVGVAILISSFWYIPMMATTNSSRFLEPSTGGPVPFSDLFSLNYLTPFFSLPRHFTVVLIVFFLVAFWGLFWRRKNTQQTTWAAIPTFLIGVMGALFYAFGRNFVWYPKTLSASGFAPFASLPFVVIFAGLLLAGVLGAIFEKLKNSIWAITFSLLGVVLITFFFWKTPFFKFTVYDLSKKDTVQAQAIPPVKNLNLDENFRFGTDSAFVSDWFNYLYPNLSQTRDYIYQGIPYKSWQYFQEYTLWTQEGRYPEDEWLLDWYGIKYFTVGLASGNTRFEKFTLRPDLFEEKYVNSDKTYYIFEYKKAKPILSVTEATPILVIGKDEDYEIFVRSLALVGWGSDVVIPVYGGGDINKFDKTKLSFFPIIFLNRFTPTTSISERDLILNYLIAGGNILVEAAPESQILTWPGWSPVAQGQIIEVKNKWNFTKISDKLEISEQDFSPPLFGSDPWKVQKARVLESLDVENLFEISGQPVVVWKRFQKGGVVWSSFNLPYHAESYRNEKEVLLLAKFFNLSTSFKKSETVKILKNKPQERIWEVDKKMTGFVWKESWFPRWTISWKDSKNKKGDLISYKAGPSLSYFFLPQDAVYPIKIYANYHLNFLDYLGWVITILIFLCLIVYLIKGRILPPIFANLASALSKKIGEFWKREEDTQ